MKNMTEKQGQKTFFKKLKETVRTINNNVSEINREMAIPKCDLPENSAINKLNDVENNLNDIKEEALCLERDLQQRNDLVQRFHGGMTELVLEMEEKLANITEYVKKYGYQPEEHISAIHQVSISRVQENRKEFCTPAQKREESCAESGILRDRTPMLIDYGLMSSKKLNLKSNMNPNSIHSSVQRKMKLQSNFNEVENQMNANYFTTPMKQPNAKEDKKLTEKLEEILEKTPMVSDFSLTRKIQPIDNMASPNFSTSLQKKILALNEDCTEEILVTKSLARDITMDKQDSTPELPLPLVFNTTSRIIKEKEKMQLTPEQIDSSIIMESVKKKQINKTPELNLTSYRKFV